MTVLKLLNAQAHLLHHCDHMSDYFSGSIANGRGVSKPFDVSTALSTRNSLPTLIRIITIWQHVGYMKLAVENRVTVLGGCETRSTTL